jgi:phage baseplate assembly protein W
MPGISPKLPLGYHKNDVGYELNKNLKENVQQNLKNLLLTNQGERVFDVRFGAGLRSFLFELSNDSIKSMIAERINSQIQDYMPFIGVDELEIDIDEENNKLFVSLAYTITTLNLADTLSLEISRI